MAVFDNAAEAAVEYHGMASMVKAVASAVIVGRSEKLDEQRWRQWPRLG